MPLRQPRRAGLLLKSGQTTQYSGELDDGYHEVGLTKRYLILTTGQHSGVCSFELDGKTETQSHNCVRDLVTGLMWARYTSAESASVGAGADGKMAWTGTDDDVFQYCAAANAAELGGYDDWRIPNITEIKSLVDMGAGNALPDSTVFPGWSRADYYWTSSTNPAIVSQPLSLDFTVGVGVTSLVSWVRFTALVRGGV